MHIITIQCIVWQPTKPTGTASENRVDQQAVHRRCNFPSSSKTLQQGLNADYYGLQCTHLLRRKLTTLSLQVCDVHDICMHDATGSSSSLPVNTCGHTVPFIVCPCIFPSPLKKRGKNSSLSCHTAHRNSDYQYPSKFYEIARSAQTTKIVHMHTTQPKPLYASVS